MKDNMKGILFNIQDFCVDDGPGIRTTIFLKGCPLNCQWCHNPESHEQGVEIFYHEDLCVSCGKCMEICPNHAHEVKGGQHIFYRSLCKHCAKCSDGCISQALLACGEEMEARDIVAKIKCNIPFYNYSGGGITISGGEPLFQPAFTFELCQLFKQEGISVCLETSGYGKTEDVAALLPYVDYFLFDYKIDAPYAQKYIGISSDLIIKNLSLINSEGKNIILRCPIIPNVNFNDAHFHSIISMVQNFKHIIEVHLLAYHPLGIDKSVQLGKQSSYKNKFFLDKTELEPHAEMIQTKTKIKTLIL